MLGLCIRIMVYFEGHLQEGRDCTEVHTGETLFGGQRMNGGTRFRRFHMFYSAGPVVVHAALHQHQQQPSVR